MREFSGDRRNSIQVWSRCNVGDLLPKEILPAEESTVPCEALVSQRAATLATLNTVGVPHTVKNVQKEPVKNWTVATSAQQQHLGSSRCALGVVGGAAVDSSRGNSGRVATTRLHPVTDRQSAHLFLPTTNMDNRQQESIKYENHCTHLIRYRFPISALIFHVLIYSHRQSRQSSRKMYLSSRILVTERWARS